MAGVAYRPSDLVRRRRRLIDNSAADSPTTVKDRGADRFGEPPRL